MIKHHRMVGCTGHFRMRFPVPALAGREYFSILDSRRCMAMRCGILGNAVPGLCRPGCQQLPCMLKRFGKFRIFRQVAQLIRIAAYLEQLFCRAGVGEQLLLLSGRSPGSMGIPQFFPGGEMRIRFVAKVGLIGEIVLDVNKISQPHHPLMVPVYMPVMFGKHVLAHLGLWIFQDRKEALTLNALRFLDSCQLQASGAQVDHTDEAVGHRWALNQAG